ncbi:MAG: adenosylmethionine decarboxylase [Rhodospirillales bacterium]
MAKTMPGGAVLEQISDKPADYFVEKDGLQFAGTHLIVELWGARRLEDPEGVGQALIAAAEEAKATILHTHMHSFGPGQGVSGVVVLAESHISIHTWPERDYAAIDIFMCGVCNPYDGIPALKRWFAPDQIQLTEHKRGMIL